MSEIKDRTKIFMDPKNVGIDIQKCDKVYQPSNHVLFSIYLLLSYNWYTTHDLNNVVCDDKHWQLHVINIESKCVEILSSTSLGRQNSVPKDLLQLTIALRRCVKAWGLKFKVDFTKFDHVCLDVPK